ncbi:hypothetical protein [Erwinia sp. HR93]|uniref:hypothetical protein n=1 Tax=Erwinia sp. HR93 TaxID=3094840 RepID=UPI002ADEEF68|nr:hypothetical protein [Erwinia sp. HR93]MEA1064935.1 hypothetical protein [Erwinia sp. HR93]
MLSVKAGATAPETAVDATVVGRYITNHRFPQRVAAQCGSVTIGTLQAADAANIINEKR